MKLHLVFGLFLAVATAFAGPRGRMFQRFQELQQSCVEETVSLALESHLESTLESFSSLESFTPSSDLTLTTERFTLRPLGNEDLHALIPILTDPKVAEMSGDYLDEYTIRQLIGMGRKKVSQFQEGTIINFGIFDQEKLIGMSQLGGTYPDMAMEKGIAKPGEVWVEVSYHLSPEYWGKGVATEVAKATTTMAFQRWDVAGIHGQTIASNDGSGKVLQKLGMELIGKRRFASLNPHEQGNNYYAMKRPEKYKREPSSEPTSTSSGPQIEPYHNIGLEPFVGGLEPFIPGGHPSHSVGEQESDYKLE